MARTRKSARRIKLEAQRLTWTRFHLPRSMSWPSWSLRYDNRHIGPLTDVVGCMKVLLGRQVEDPEQASLIILWSSSEALQAFESSPAHDQLLHDLRGNQTSPTSLFALLYDVGFELEEALHGRVTLTILHVRYDGGEIPLGIQSNLFSGFTPAGAEDLDGPPTHQRMSLTWSAREKRQQDDNPPCEFTCYAFFRWNGNGGTPEREDASAHSLEAQQSWADAVAKATPPVVAWEQQRWQIHAAPGYAEDMNESEFECFPYYNPFGRYQGPSSAGDYILRRVLSARTT